MITVSLVELFDARRPGSGRIVVRLDATLVTTQEDWKARTDERGPHPTWYGLSIYSYRGLGIRTAQYRKVLQAKPFSGLRRNVIVSCLALLKDANRSASVRLADADRRGKPCWLDKIPKGESMLFLFLRVLFVRLPD